ncbi:MULTISPECIES: arsenic resistance N-acetyltransferase ArsN2 [Halolamina]|uniref:Amino-acid N-acetyltransferase n=1 Tax=Halolamina pelagica TaxID=699431 RepID=A0A1I5PQR2_9EURY|nr:MULTISPECIES: arsenic resistance N-acetyltransferase ArsN2 [Halolamina]NHX34900.1 GNAT family N-acetyltransferase [Halolamina sp. R1-12]SFP35871.1 amino-acid N-acetyltransferase [Halolamina pelagica]
MPQNPDTPVTLTPVDSEREAEWVRRLLARSGLPTEDLSLDGGPEPAGGNPTLYTVEADGDRVGCVGLERDGDAGLLRSAAVAEPHRGRGYGGAAVRALEARARAAGVGTLYLLTTTAAEFFAGLGYERVNRESVPESIRESAEFSDLCPSSATVMRRRL